jgi:membrane-bound ClpP family serine protease
MQPTIIYSFMPAGYEETTLIIFGFLFLLFELFFVSYGILAFMGLSALGLGLYHIYTNPEVLGPFKQSIILGSTLGFLISFIFFFWWLRRDMKKNHRHDFFILQGKIGVITQILHGKNPPFNYQIKIHGEIWQAESQTLLKLEDEVEVIKQKEDALILEIKPRG